MVSLDSGSLPHPMCPSLKPVTTLTVSLLLGLEMDRAATRTYTLVLQGDDSLRAAIDLDIEKIETSISHFQESLTSLSKVVLQNRRSMC